MTEFFRLFQQITAVADLAPLENLNSNEIYYSATRLGEAIQPCLDELQRSATALQDLLQPCFTELAQAEAVWNSKPHIVGTSAIEIREHLGHLSGYCFKLQRSRLNLIQMVTEKVKRTWQTRVEAIKEKWFGDQDSRSSKTVNFPDKEKFIQALNEELYPVSTALYTSLQAGFQPIQAQLKHLQLSRVQDHLNLLDTQKRSDYKSLLKSLDLPSLYLNLEEPYRYFPDGTQNLLDTVAPAVEELIDQGFLVGNATAKTMIKFWMGQGLSPFTWENFAQFSEKVEAAIAKITKAIVEDRIALILNLLDRSMQFYDDFLEQQQRYQQETPEQRQTEQRWLAARRQSLEQVRDDTARVASLVRQS